MERWSTVERDWPEAERRLCCENCSGEDFYDEDGFSYCSSCNAQSQEGPVAVIIPEGSDGQIYNIVHQLKKSQTVDPPPRNRNSEQVLRNLSQNLAGGGVNEEEAERARARGFEDKGSGPQDFGGGGLGVDAEALRLRYVEGLQVMLQLQCEALVEKFGVSPLICGFAGTIWLRYVASSRVFEEGWADKVIAESEAAMAAARARDGQQEEKIYIKRIKAKYRREPHNRYGQRAVLIWFRSLRKTIPVHSSVSISYLACHLARGAVLPTDIAKWALEGKLPYLAAFVDMDKYLGNPSNAVPLSSRVMFRPIQLVGAWELEATAGSIAQAIGLRIPSVNFYAIACRYLKDLSLPVEKILPHACRLYEWAIPANLWLSSNLYRLPTHVCVMSILIVTVRILYNIHGQGVWEMSLSNLSNSSSHNQKALMNSAPKFEKKDGDDKECYNVTDPIPVENESRIQAAEFNTKELLFILEAAYDKISNILSSDYSKDLQSYLNYCKGVVFVGRPTSFEEERLIEKLWNIYEKPKDSDPKEEVKSEKRPRAEEPTSTSSDSKKLREESQDSLHTDKGKPTNQGSFVSNTVGPIGETLTHDYPSTASTNSAVVKMKLDMEENGFHYLPPRAQQRSDGYVSYRRQLADGKLNCVAHADYYILLRACARLAQVDARIMHFGVLKLERMLGWIEQRIGISLSSLTRSDRATDPHR